MHRLRSSITLPADLSEVQDGGLEERYPEYLTVIPVHQMYTTQRSIASVGLTQGAFSSIKEVRETSTGHIYAVKVTSIGEEDLVKIAVKEYETLRDLSHPCIVQPSHFLLDSALRKTYMFMPVLTEKTVSDLISEETSPRPETEVRLTAYQLFDALSYIHSRGIIHRDINPNNILCTPNHPTLIDFQTCVRDYHCKWMMSYVGTGKFTAPEMRTRPTYT